VPSVRRLDFRETSIRDALLFARDQMLPGELSDNPLSRWISGFDSLSFVDKIDAKLIGPVPLSQSFLGQFATSSLQEACGFYFASLFHIGRILQTSRESLSTISRLQGMKNFNASVKALGIQEYELSSLCIDGIEYHSFRVASAQKSWLLWQAHVAVLQVVVKRIEEDSQIRAFATADTAATSIVICTHLMSSFLDENAMLCDRALFRVVPVPGLRRFLDELESHHAVFYKVLNERSDWDQAAEEANILLKAVRSRYIPTLENGPSLKQLLRRITKLFIVAGRKPPLWENVVRLGNEFWIHRALRAAEVSVHFVIDNFAVSLLQFLEEQNRKSGSYIPFSDPDWNEQVNLFFNQHWIASLVNAEQGQIRSLALDPVAFQNFVEACAALLSAMGYSVKPWRESYLPPGTHGKPGEAFRTRSFFRP
jgi:hypothetical protein